MTQNYYNNIIVYNLLTTFNLKNFFEIPKINKIYLNIGFKDTKNNKQTIKNIEALLTLIINQKIFLTSSKKTKVSFKIKKNSIIGCKVTLQKKKLFIFLDKFFIFILPNIKNIILNRENNNILNFQINNILNFFELKTEFLKFKDKYLIDISIHTNTKNNFQLFLLLNYFIFNLKRK